MLDQTVTALALSLRPVPGKTVTNSAQATTPPATINLAGEPHGMPDATCRREGPFKSLMRSSSLRSSTYWPAKTANPISCASILPENFRCPLMVT